MVDFSKRMSIEEVKKAENGSKITIGGWAEHLVHKGKICFLTVRDASDKIQVTGIKTKLPEELWESILALKNETIIWVEGIVKENAQAPGGLEIIPEFLEVLNPIHSPMPIDVTGRTPMDDGSVYAFRELTIRMPKHKLPLEVKGFVAQATREFFMKRGFTELFAPMIVATATEGGATMFPMKYFEEDAFLAQSAQFYKQAAVTAHEKVFGILPSFRMEKSRTRKHVSEFWQIECEIGFTDHLGAMQVLEDLTTYIVNKTIKTAKKPLKKLGAKPKKLTEAFPRVTFKEAKELCSSFELEDPIDFNDDFTSPEEVALSKHFKTPFFITEWPTHTRGIYYRVNDDDPDISNSFDLMAPNGFAELCTGGQRVHEYDKMADAITKQGYSLEGYEWYLNLFKFGMPPHAGFGLGIERLSWWICGLDNIKQMIMFPRTVDILKP